MAENAKSSEPVAVTPPPVDSAPPVPPRRSPGHRGADVKDTVAEMAAKAHEISLEAGSKMSAAMKDVVNAAAGLTGFVMESARDLVQFMVRRGQMTQEEADKLIRQVEEHQPKRKPAAPPPPPKHEAKHPHAPAHAAPSHQAPKVAAKPAPAHHAAPAKHAKPAKVVKLARPAKHAKAASKPPKKASKPAPKKPAPKKPAPKKPAPKKTAPKKAPAKKPAAKKAAKSKRR